MERDIVYIIGKGISKCDYFDLRCSLRSLQQYGKNYGKVIVAGYCPEWLSENVIKVPFTQPYENTSNMAEKHINIQETLRYVVEHIELTDEFVVSMSDHFLTRPVDFSTYPFCCRLGSHGTVIPEEDDAECSKEYNRFMRGTKKYLESTGLGILYTVAHRDMLVSVKSIKECAAYFDDIRKNKKMCEPFCLLGNWEYKNGSSKNNIKYYIDYKVRKGSEWWKTSRELTDMFSTAPFSYGVGLYTLLKEKYSEKSIYEKQ